MGQRAIVVVVFVGLLASLATATSVAADSRFRGRGGRTLGVARQHAPAVHTHRFDHRRRFPRHFGGFGVVVAAPVVVYTPSLFAASLRADPAPYAPPVISGPPPVVFSPPPPPFSQPAPAPLPRVVQHPTGRYELRGDGIGTPYNWVWIPNPPPPPPAPPAAPPAGTPNGPPTSGDALPTRELVYQWVDDQGVAHWTNRADRVPRRYREEARPYP
jgi:hypothetical protein